MNSAIRGMWAGLSALGHDLPRYPGNLDSIETIKHATIPFVSVIPSFGPSHQNISMSTTIWIKASTASRDLNALSKGPVKFDSVVRIIRGGTVGCAFSASVTALPSTSIGSHSFFSTINKKH